MEEILKVGQRVKGNASWCKVKGRVVKVTVKPLYDVEFDNGKSGVRFDSSEIVKVEE